MKTNGYTIHEYNPSFNAGLAQMWNESDDQWPGTFTRGVPFDEDRIVEWMERVTAIVKYVVAAPDGNVVGYGDLWEDMDRPRSCYVALLNVHPKHQGKSLARRMLARMVEWATENGYDRMTIGTWSANLKAMPLYKKVGFFWVPDTNVFMENYVPAVRQLPLAHAFFEKHDWYCTYDRELKQVEDDMRHPRTGEMKVYVLRWRADGDLLETVIDRNAQALTGIKTNTFSAYVRVAESEPAQGVDYPIYWEIENTSDRPLPISVLADGEPGIELEYRQSLSLAPGETQLFESKFHCRLDAPDYDDDKNKKTTPKIKTVLVVNGQAVEFGTGLRYRPPIEFSLGPEGVSLLPGQSKTIWVQIRNRVSAPIQGTVHITPQPDLDMDWLTHEFQAQGNGYMGIPVTLTPKRDGDMPFEVRATFSTECSVNRSPQESDSGAITTLPKQFPMVVPAPGGLAAGKDDGTIVVENDFFHLKVKRKAGKAELYSKLLKRKTALIQEELGPPFVPWELEQKSYEMDLVREQGGVKILLTAESGRFPGLTLTREMIVTASPLITIRHRVANNGTAPQEFQIRPYLDNLRGEQMQVTLPLESRTVTEHASQFGLTHGDIPEDTAKFAEQWIAYSENNYVTGLIWPSEAEKLLSDWGGVFVVGPKKRLHPGQALTSNPVYVYAGPGGWQIVKETWQRVTSSETLESPNAEKYYHFDFLRSPVVTLDDHVEVQLKAQSTRKYTLEGRMTVHAPPGWTASNMDFSIDSLNDESTFCEPLRLEAVTNAKVGAVEGHLSLQTQLLDAERPFTLLRLGDSRATVEINQTERGGHNVWLLANGSFEWAFAPEFHGGGVTWREVARETDHLLTSFPHPGELSWLKPYFGGLRPTLHDPVRDKGWPGKLHEETFQVEEITASDERDLPWQGLRLSAEIEREVFCGLRAEIDYLSLPDSNVLKIVYRLVNKSGVYRYAEPGLFAFLAVDGTHKNGVIHSEEIHRKRTPGMAYSALEGWAAVENPDTRRAIVLVAAMSPQKVMAVDWGESGAHLYGFQVVQVPPQESTEMVLYLALAESAAEAHLYQALSDL